MNLETSNNLICKKDEISHNNEKVFSLKINDQPIKDFISTKKLIKKEVTKISNPINQYNKFESHQKSTFSAKVTPPESSDHEYDIKKLASDEILIAKKNCIFS